MRSWPALCTFLLLAACQMAGPGTARPGGALSDPVLVQGTLSRAEEAEAERLFSSAEESFRSRRFFEVVRTTTDLMDRFPSSEVSGAALLLTARAELELGAPDRAVAAADRYLDLLPPGDPRTTEVVLLQVAALQDDPSSQLERLLTLDQVADEGQLEPALAATRSAVAALSTAEIRAVLAASPADGQMASVPLARLAVDLLERGEIVEAEQLASAAIATGAADAERVVAEGVLRGELPPERERITDFTLGLVLPEGGPPALAGFAREIAEGVEVAVSTVLGEPYRIEVTTRDDEANSALAALIASELELEGVTGAVGFLEDEVLLAAAQSRVDGMPIVSPTARSAGGAGEGVYSLEGPDPQAAAEIARYAADRAYQRVAIILPSSQAAIEEADAFEAEAARWGVPVVQRFYYEPGATFFETQVVGARDLLRAAELRALGLGEEDTLRVETLEPVGIFVPIPREDVAYVAPQIAHFALDTLGIEVVGTSAWTDPGVLETVDPLYTNGVVATATVGAGPSAPGRQRFREAYEAHFQRSLVSSAPALGYDAALLLLEALRPGRVQPAQVQESFLTLQDVEGATGIFSVVDGRVVRRTEVVRIRDRQLEPVPIF